MSYEFSHPLSDYVMSVPLPNGLHIPERLETYDGSSDPKYHLDVFNCHYVLFFQPSDPIKCCAFATTLRKTALRWFLSLPSKGIDNFSQLRSKFLSYFSHNIVQPKTTILIGFHQHRNESLRDYLIRFECKASQIEPKLDDQVAIWTIANGLKLGHFLDSLITDPPIDSDDLKMRAMGYINMEEDQSKAKRSADEYDRKMYKGKRKYLG